LAAFVDDGWEHLANAYADVLGQQSEVELQRMIGKRLARVFEEQLQDVQKAEETYTYVLSVAALDVDCLENLDRIYTALGQPAQLAGVLEQRVQTVSEPYQLIELYGRLGEIYELQLAPQDARHLDDAVRVYRKIFDELEPQNETAQVVLERIYGQQQRWQDLFGVYERQLATASGDFEKGEICAKMARLLAGYLGDARRAIETWRRVLELKGEDGEALGALSELYNETQQWAELTEVLERHLAMVVDEGEHVAVLLRRARLHMLQLGRDDLALDDYIRALDIDFANIEALYAINDIWRKRYTGELSHDTRGNPQELLSALHQTADRAAQALPAEHLVALYRELATLHQLDQEQRFDAIDAWRKLLEVDPRDFDAMAQLETLLRAEERWEEVVEVKMMRARAYDDPAEKVREYLEVAHVWEHQIGNEDGGTPALEAVLELEPAHDDAFHQLEKLHKAASRWEPLIELYVARVETREDVGERTILLRKVARIFDEQLHDQVQAYESLETAFALDFTDNDTVAYLEKMAAATKRWGQLIQSVTALEEQAADPHVKVILCLRLAKWYGDDLDRQDYAHPFFGKVSQLDPNNVQARRQLAGFKKKQMDWQGAGRLLEEALHFAARDSDRAAILTDVGELLEKYANQPEQGVARYQRAVEADGTYMPAIEALERIYESRNMMSELVGMLERKSKALKDNERIAEVRLRMAALLEGTLANPEKAITAYRGVLEVDAGNLQAIRGLERVYGALQKSPELLEVLEMHLDVAATERERADVLVRIAGLQEEEFRKPDLAAARLEQVVDIDPTNLQAFEALARCYHKQQQWRELIGCLDRYIQIVDDRRKKIELFTWQAQIFGDQLQDHEKSLDSYLAIADLDPQHVPALEALAKLYERMDDPASAIDYMTRVAELTSDGGQRVEAFYRIGKQLEDKLGDRTQARTRFEQALDLNPNHQATLAALRVIAIDEADWYTATRHLETEQQYTESPRLKAKLLVELGRLRHEMMEQPDLAVQAYQMAHQADPDNEDAALPLARFYAQQQRFAEAEPLTELLEKKASTKERDQQIELFMLHGRVEMAVGKGQEALRAFTNAHKIDLTNRDAIRGLADANFLLRDWAGALTNYQKVLTALGDDEGEQRAEILFKLGCVKREQGQVKQAINNFEKALGLKPAHRPTLEALAQTYESLNDWAQSCAYRQQILDNVLDGDERFKLLLELSDIWADKVGDPVQALNALEQAADLHPEDHQLQHKLLALYQKTSRWDQVVSTLQRIAEGDPNPQRRARYLFTMAQVYRDKLDDPYQAVALFDEALDLNPDYLDAFMRVDKILTSINDWAKLERAYRKMLHRIVGKGNAELEYNLWHALGLVYRDRLQDFAKARDAFSAALAVKPDAADERKILAELELMSGDPSKALEQYRSLLERDALNVDAYRAIYTIYLQQQAYDEAWCVASVLAFAGRANEEEQRFFEDWRPQDIPQITGTLDGATWIQHLFHKDEDAHIGKIFEAVALSSLKAKIADQTAKNQRPVLPDSARQDPASSTGTFARTFWWAAKALAISAPQLYARSDQPGGLVAVANIPPSSVAGQTVLQGLSPLERAFVCAKHLAMYRGEHYIKTLFPTVTELTVLLFGAVRLVAQLPAPPEYANQVQATTQVLNQYIEPIQREALKVAVNNFMKAGARANIKRWAQAVETTAARAGLLLAGDLNVAKKIIVNEQQIPNDLTPQERLKELMLFMVSDENMRMRKALGMSIRPEG
jgi:tetratricopeptide (TPR) repeat protein